MKITITNATRQLLIVPLNSGTTLHLAPGASSDPIDESEINDNAKIAKLRDAGLVSLTRREAA